MCLKYSLKMEPLKLFAKLGVRVMSPRFSSFILRKDLWKPDNVVISPFKDIEKPNSTITEYIWKNVEKWPEKTAVICGITNHFYTYQQLYKLSRTFGVNLRTKFGIKDGDVVCIMLSNSPDYIVAFLGILEAGAEVTTVNPIYTAHEVQRQLVLSDSKLVIGSTETVKVIKEALKLAKKELPVVVVKNSNEDLPVRTVSFQELIEDNSVDFDVLKEVKRKSEDTAILPYSSGTTGLPKGVELTNYSIVVNCMQQDVDGAKVHQDTTASYQDSILAVLPFYHIYGLVILMLHKMSIGAKLVTLPKFQPDKFLSSLKDHRVSLLYTAPPMVLFIGSNPNAKKEHLESVNKIMAGAAPLAKRDIILALEKLKKSANFLQIYGLTEASPLATVSLADTTNYTSAGYALSSMEMKIVGEEQKALGPNEVGELWLRGPQIMKGYRNNPEATKNTLTEDGWLKTGDLAFLDKEGTVTIADRLKELIKVKGYQVPPAELEAIIKEHPAVLDAGVIGIPDARAGEVPKAFVVVKEGHNIDTDDIKEFVKERVAEFKRIKEVAFLDALPKNPSGKLLRRVLKEKN